MFHINQGYHGVLRFSWPSTGHSRPTSCAVPWLPLISKMIQFSGWQWRFKEESRDPLPPRGSQARRWMKRMAWVPLKGYPRITQSEIIILTCPGLCKSGYLIPTYLGICKTRHVITTYGVLGYPNQSLRIRSCQYQDIEDYPTYPDSDLPRVSFFQMIRGISSI